MKIRMFVGAALSITLACVTACGQSVTNSTPTVKPPTGTSGLTVRYLGNEGVMISSGKRKVLIDALHREYRSDYAFPPPALLSSLETAVAPYDQIDLILVSHIHLDHFHPLSVGLCIKNNPGGTLVSSEQVTGQVEQTLGAGAAFRDRIKQVTPGWQQKVELNVAGIKLAVLGLRHSGEQMRAIQNLGHLLEIDGKRFLHVGDADMTVENFAAFKLSEVQIDVAFIPYWYLLSEAGRKLVREQFGAKQVIAVHIPPREAAEIAAELGKVFPGAVAFTRLLEEKIY
jgi:L-ascorbate metabolism protein UlaG (beta-lactamase superfamily)